MAKFNPTQIFQWMDLWYKFTKNHPKFLNFLQAAAKEGIQEGAILEVNLITPEGKHYRSNLKITKDDMELLAQIKETMP